jgi:hypothetical protein
MKTKSVSECFTRKFSLCFTWTPSLLICYREKCSATDLGPFHYQTAKPIRKLDRHTNLIKSVKPLWKVEGLGITFFVLFLCLIRVVITNHMPLCEDLIQRVTKVTWLSMFNTLFIVSSDFRAILYVCLPRLLTDHGSSNDLDSILWRH